MGFLLLPITYENEIFYGCGARCAGRCTGFGCWTK